MSRANRIEKPEHSEIVFKGLRFLITERPSDATLDSYVAELRDRGCTDVVRVCEPSYAVEKLVQAGIRVHDLHFEDGSPPTADVMDRWFDLVRARFVAPSADNNGKLSDACIAVHCVAGLGRAPVLVALTLIEKGMKYEDAVCTIREKRHKAINAKQLEFLRRYKPVGYLKSGRLNSLFNTGRRRNTVSNGTSSSPTATADRSPSGSSTKRKVCALM